MTGLEDRLRRVRGVTDLSVELGEDGLEAIRVRIDETSDEGEVLEEIRRILVAYGLRSRRTSVRSEPIPEIEPEDLGPQPTPEPSGVPPAAAPVRVSVRPVEGRLRVELSSEDRTVSADADATPLGAAEAMVRALSEWHGRHALPRRVAVERILVDEEDVLVVLVRTRDRVGAGAAVVDDSLAEALRSAATLALAAVN